MKFSRYIGLQNVSCEFSLHSFVLYQMVLSDSGDEGIRTPDPLLARQVLSQLSYTPVGFYSFYGLFKSMGLNGPFRHQNVSI